MQNLKFLNVLALFLVIFSSCGKEMPTTAPSDTAVSIEKIDNVFKTWNGNDDDDWLLGLSVKDQSGSPVEYALSTITDENGIQYMSVTDSEGSADVEVSNTTFQYISLTQAGVALEIESAVQSGNTIDVQLK